MLAGFETHPVLVAFAAFAAIACFTWDSLPHIPWLNTSFSTLEWQFTNQNCNDMGVKPKAYHHNCHSVVNPPFSPLNKRAIFVRYRHLLRPSECLFQVTPKVALVCALTITGICGVVLSLLPGRIWRRLDFLGLNLGTIELLKTEFNQFNDG